MLNPLLNHPIVWIVEDHETDPPIERERHPPEEIIKKLKTAEEVLAGGKTVEKTCRILAVSGWKRSFGKIRDTKSILHGGQIPRHARINPQVGAVSEFAH